MIQNLNITQAINIFLISLCGAIVLSYVLWANGLAASNYQISALRDDLARLTEVNSSLLAEKSATENPKAAMRFAQEQNMVPASNTSYIFENGNVALRQ